MIQRFEQFSYDISSIYRLILKLEKEEMEKNGYRGSYALYLSVMSRYPGGITAARLGELCDRDKAGISRTIGEMEANGLVRRECYKDNFYRAKLILTPKGKEAAQFVRQRAEWAVTAAGQGISEEDRRAMYACLEIIEANLRKICEESTKE